MKLKKGGRLASLLFGFRNRNKEQSAVAPEIISESGAGLQRLEGSELANEPAIDKAPSDEPVGARPDPEQVDIADYAGFEALAGIDAFEGSSLTTSNESINHATELKIQESIMENADYEEHDRLIINYTRLQLTQCERQLKEFMQLCPGAYGALISTVDGHEVAYTLKRDLPPHKISTMNSSLLALGESIARESQQQLCQFVIVENSNGRVVSLRINDLLMLTCISSKEINLGMLLSVGRNTASTLQQILSE
ncbi:MAG: hypothetical protein IPP10_08900 [Candidatus Competibacteraceae bacterium]|nr:hypothetical protein [Candidatus Competibacteraceae bacterium]MBK7982854.1 hypothetical protein [Candidatus Competibacteraceae bacterium]MBK8898599.1 hypothetical protein [Candidatus Competibacteraceae bacterium]MBK8962402.1 hypothetical protein [Candidatus Competibacteraceae bacterium]MBK9951617.1 hypothetical protein [Candidatus Competibacteraceae bacterium]